VGELEEDEKDGTIFSAYGIDYRFVSGPLGVKTAEELFDRMAQGDYITIIAVKDEGSAALTDGIVEKARAVGLKFDLAEDGYRKSYLAVLDGKAVVYEEMSDQKLEYTVKLDGHNIALISAGYEVGNSASIQVDNVEYAKNRRGLNIVVFNKLTESVIDSASVDTFSDNKVSR